MRREFSKPVKAAAFLACKGWCAACKLKIVGKPEYDHIVPDALEGLNDIANCQVLCAKCHRHKTRARDIPMISKAERTAEKEAGIRRTRSPLPFGRRSPWKKKMDGTVVKR